MKKEFCRAFFIIVMLLNALISYQQNLESWKPDDSDSLNSVWATVMNDNTLCRVSWNWNTWYWEIAYDDNEADDFFVYTQAGSLSAVRFTPTGSPTRVVGGRIYVGDGTFPGPFLGTGFRVIVFDDDGTDGLPGTALDSMNVTVNNYYWVEFEGLDAIIPSGDFYLAIRQLEPSPNAAPVGIDTDNPTYFRSYAKFLDNEWQLSAFQDFMVRARITSAEEDSSSYIVHRFSGFDPNGSPLLGDTAFLDTTDLHFYDDLAWDSLAEGWFAYGVKEQYPGGGTSEYVISNIVGHFDTIPSITPSCFYQADTGSMPLVICPPYDSTGSIPFNFVGYTIYLNGNEVDVLPPETITYLPDCITPCRHNYSITAVYDLAPFGFPGEYGESMEIQTEYIVKYGFPLDFQEDWGPGSFDTNNWTTESENWIINGAFGNPSPSAEFTWDPLQTNYSIGLESYPFMADSMFAGRIYLDFDIKLDEYLSTGTEMMQVEIWDWESQEWMAIDSFSNEFGSFDWMPLHLDVSEQAFGKVFKIKFSAKGEASLNIQSWYIDNIHVYRECAAPFDLELEVIAPWEIFELTWEYPDTNYFPQAFGIYRSDDGGPWFLRDTSHVGYYEDDSVCMATGKLAFQYKVTAFYIEGNDSCESDYSNEVMEVCEGIHEDENDFYLKVYPNPARDLIHVEIGDDISFKKPEGDDISLAKLLNSKGQIIWENEINTTSFIIPVRDYPEGVYLLRVETGKGVVSRKVILMR